MKKLLALLLALCALCGLVACGDESDEEDVSVADHGLGELAEGAGLERGVIFSTLSDADKAKLEQYASTQGIDVVFADDGSTAFIYNAGTTQKKTVTQSSDGTVALVEGDGGDAKLNDTWPQNELTALLPVPTFEVTSEANLNGKLTIYFGAVTAEEMRDYAAQLKATGFDSEVIEKDSDGAYSFAAYNADGVKVELDTMGIGSVKITPAQN